MGEEKKKSDGGENSNNNVVLKVDCTCDGCASKIKHCLRSYPGVDNVKADTDTGKITVTGKVSDPAKMKKKLEEKLNKKVTLISPQLKKEKNNNNGDDKENNKTDANNNKKEKEKETPPVITTAVLKVALHCQGCVDKIRKTVSKTKGVTEMGIDKEKETVTVKGTMDVKALAANLMEKLKRKVEVVPPKKPDNKENNGGGGEGKKNKGGGGGGGGGGGNNNEEMAVMMEQNRMEYMGGQAVGYGYGYGGYGYGGPVMMHPHHHGGYSSYVPVYTYPEQLHFHAPPPQIFSDENPHACSIM